jgi:CubicO group peptidase (beta-lactamase class C family)
MDQRIGTPEQAGVSSLQVDKIIDRVGGWVAAGVHPALVVLAARRGVIFLHEAFGRLGPGEDLPPLLKDAVFPIASITKPITATAAMLLVEEGLLGLNRPVRDYIPEFQGEWKDEVLVWHLMTHTSGIADDEVVFGSINEKVQAGIELSAPEGTEDPRVHRALHYGFDVPLARKPGTLMVYSSYGFYLLGEIIRRLSGKSLAALANDRIFAPLGMMDTSYALPKKLTSRAITRPDDAPFAVFNKIEQRNSVSPAGGVWSTAMDMAIFGQMYLNKGSYGDQRILSPASIAAMTRNQIPGISGQFFDEFFDEASWGLGWGVNLQTKDEPLLSPSAILHGGAGGVHFWVDPEFEIVGVYFSVLVTPQNGDPSSEPLMYADLFMNMVTTAIEG